MDSAPVEPSKICVQSACNTTVSQWHDCTYVQHARTSKHQGEVDALVGGDGSAEGRRARLCALVMADGRRLMDLYVQM